MKSSTCFKQTRKMAPRGILIHSTGANNPYLKRYVQPNNLNNDKAYLLTILGKNINGNDWNHIEHQAGVNAFIGKLNNEQIATVQTLPWIFRPWGCGSGPKGSCNDNWIQIEICEDDLNNRNYFEAIYNELIELIAYLCKIYNINPSAYVDFKGVSVPTILCHADSYDLGLGSNHGDIRHWFPKYGRNMSTVREDVCRLLNKEEDEDEMTQEKFNEMMDIYLNQRCALDPDTWSKEAREWCEANGIIKGTTEGWKQYKKLLTKEEMAQMIYNLSKLN